MLSHPANLFLMHYEKLGSELDMKSFDHSQKKEVSKSVKLYEKMSFQDSNSKGILDLPVTLAEVNYVVILGFQPYLHDKKNYCHYHQSMF